MGAVMTSNFSEIAKTSYLFSSFGYFKLREYLNRNSHLLNERVCEYFEIISGFAFSSEDYVEDGGIKLLRIGDILKSGNIFYDDMLQLPEEYTSFYERFLLKETDIVIAMTGATIGKSGIVENLQCPVLLNQRVGILRLKESNKYNIKFFYYVTKTEIFRKQILIYAMGKSQPNVSPFDILKVQIPKVEFSKQNEIISKVFPIEFEIQQLKLQIQDSSTIINKIFAKIFGYSPTLWKEFGKGMTAGTQKSNVKPFKYFEIPFRQIQTSNIFRFSSRFHNQITQELTKILKRYPTVKVGKIITEKVHRGVQPKFEPEGEIYAIKTGQLKNGCIDLSECEMVSREFYQNNENAHVRKDDILIASTGKVSLGKIDIVEFEDDAIVDGHVSIVRLDERQYNKLFFTYFSRSILGTFQVERDFTGTTNQIELYTDQIEAFDIPDISLKKQESIVTKIKTELDKQKEIERQIEEKEKEISKIIEAAIKS